MKFPFLFLLSFAFTTAALAGDWIADAKTGCKVWNHNPSPEMTVEWSGICASNYAQGRGTLQLFLAGKPYARYEGELVDGKGTGKAISTSVDGNRYEGEYQDGKANGKGITTWTNGNRYEGEYRDGKPNGKGVYNWTNGNRYEGEFRDGKPNGKGVYTWTSGNRYEGEFRDGKPNGKGISTWTNGDRHEGEYRDGERNGQGVFTRANGERQEGEFLNGSIVSSKSSALVASTGGETVGRCTVNSDGTFTGSDGTIWQVCLYGQTWKNGECQGSAQNVSWYEAMDAAKNSNFAAQNDWILPSSVFLSGSIHPTNCVHPNISMHIKEFYWRGPTEVKINSHFWTADTRSVNGGGSVHVTDSNYLGGLNSIFYDTLKSASDFDKGYGAIYAVFVRNAPESDKAKFAAALPFVKCDAQCLSSRKAAQGERDRASVQRGEEFREKVRDFFSGSSSGSSSSSSNTGSQGGSTSGSWKVVKQYEGGFADFGFDLRSTVFVVRCGSGAEHKMYSNKRGLWGSTGLGGNNDSATLEEAVRKKCR